MIVIQEAAIVVHDDHPETLQALLITNLKRHRCPSRIITTVNFELNSRKFYTVKGIIEHVNAIMKPWKIGYRVSQKYSTNRDIDIYDLVSYRW
jgi:hypothetical protein